MFGSIGQKAWQVGRNAALGAAEYMTPVLTESQFTEKGVLTPEEFVKAGDMLVLRCPTWQWQAGDPANSRPFLPPDKQFLFTRNVPCQRRARSLMSGVDDEQDVAGGPEDEEGWLSAHASHVAGAVKDEEVPDMVDATNTMGSLALGGASSSATAEDGLEEMGLVGPPGGTSGGRVACVGFCGAGGGPTWAWSRAAPTGAAPGRTRGPRAALCARALPAPGPSRAAASSCAQEPDDPSALPPSATDNIVRSRTYDVSLTYDKYYQCARVWLYGYSEDRQPLTSEQVLEDISSDHALKTVTLEAHPHTSHGAGLHASIHPCKHASVMHKLCSEIMSSGREVRTDQYLFLFLKFISCVIPTIEYDHTISVDGL